MVDAEHRHRRFREFEFEPSCSRTASMKVIPGGGSAAASGAADTLAFINFTIDLICLLPQLSLQSCV